MTTGREVLQNAQESLKAARAEPDRRAAAVRQAEVITADALEGVKKAESEFTRIEVEADVELASAMARGRSSSNAEFRTQGAQRNLDEAKQRHQARLRALNQLKGELFQAEEAVKKASTAVSNCANQVIISEISAHCGIDDLNEAMQVLINLDNMILALDRFVTQAKLPLSPEVRKAFMYLNSLRSTLNTLKPQLPGLAVGGHEHPHLMRLNNWKANLTADAESKLDDVPLPPVEIRELETPNFLDVQRDMTKASEALIAQARKYGTLPPENPQEALAAATRRQQGLS